MPQAHMRARLRRYTDTCRGRVALTELTTARKVGVASRLPVLPELDECSFFVPAIYP
jgi:hypothetical protein